MSTILEEVREVRDLDGGAFVDGKLFFLRPDVVEWAKAEASHYRDSIPGAEFRPSDVAVYGWCGEESGEDNGRPILIVHGREIARFKAKDSEDIGGLFGGTGETKWVERDMAPDWVLLGHRTDLPAWVFNSVMGAKG